MKNSRFKTLHKAVYKLWFYGFISEFEKDSFNMRINTAKDYEKNRRERIKLNRIKGDERSVATKAK